MLIQYDLNSHAFRLMHTGADISVTFHLASLKMVVWNKDTTKPQY